MKLYIAATLMGLTLLGCASTPMADAQHDAAVKTFTIAPDKAGVFIYRDQIFGAAVKMDVWLDGAHLGQNVVGSHLYKTVEPGRHVISSNADATDALDVEIKAGSFAYVQHGVAVASPFSGKKFQRTDEAQGRKGVLATRLARNFPLTQDLEVRVAADDPAWRGSFTCVASNSFGGWPFTAPGTVTVEPSASPLKITCQALDGAAVDAIATAPVLQPTTRESTHQGAATGAKVGAGVGVALGVAAAPVMGPAFAVMLGLGAAFRGAEIGGAVGAVASGDRVAYPNPIEVHIQRVAPSD